MSKEIWNEFKKLYPHANTKSFEPYSRGINFNYDGLGYDVFMGEASGPIHHYLQTDLQSALTKALGTKTVEPSGFPSELSLTKVAYPIPSLPWNEKPAKLDSHLTISVTPELKFVAKVRRIFDDSNTEFTTAVSAREWLGGQSMKYWAQQLNFAIWCATSGCGVGLSQTNSFFRFHTMFTTRRILYELGVSLPGDAAFNKMNNHFSKKGYSKLCNEFGCGDFRFLKPANHGLGDMYAYDYHGLNIEEIGWPNDYIKFRDEGGKGVTAEILKDANTKIQYEWFVLQEGLGLTKVGLGRINRSIEAYVYCVLGSQVNIRSAIVGNEGSSIETQQEFLVLFESTIIENDIPKGVQRYQLAVQKSRARLDFAIAPGCWLLPSNLLINIHSVIGYNNMLQRATKNMKFGMNNVNDKTHTSNKVRQKVVSLSPKVIPRALARKSHAPSQARSSTHPDVKIKSPDVSNAHEDTLAAITIVTSGLTWLIFR
jgi:hypothetical protein